MAGKTGKANGKNPRGFPTGRARFEASAMKTTARWAACLRREAESDRRQPLDGLPEFESPNVTRRLMVLCDPAAVVLLA